MSEMKMSDAFKLPLKSEGWIVCSESYEIDWILDPQVDELECGSKKEAEYTAHAINNHDRMVEEIAELQAALELMVLHFESNHNSEHECEVIKLSKKILPNLNQEGEE